MWIVVGLMALVAGVSLMAIAAHLEGKALRAFIAESGDRVEDKYPEVQQFWKNYRAAKTENARQEVRDSQSAFWHYRSKKVILATSGLVLILIFCVILSLIIAL